MNWIDRAIGAVAPGAALRRLRQRQAMGLMQRAYEGAKVGRRTDGWVTAGSGANAEIAPALSAAPLTRPKNCVLLKFK